MNNELQTEADHQQGVDEGERESRVREVHDPVEGGGRWSHQQQRSSTTRA